MGRKEYIPAKRVSETIYEKRSGRDSNDSKSVTIYVEYIWNRPNSVDVLFNDCGDACKKHYGDIDIERYIHIRGAAVQKLANKFSAHDENTLLIRMADKLRNYESNTCKVFENWLELKGIEYTTSVY